MDTPELSQVKGRDRSVRESNAQPSTEVGMTHWTRCSAIAVVASLIAVPLCAQSHTVVTNDMLRNAAGSGNWLMYGGNYWRSEEHTSELQSQSNLVCRLLLEKKKKT